MRRWPVPQSLRCLFLLLTFGTGCLGHLRAAGVTIITHGFNGNVTDWVIPMAERMTAYPSFPGTTSSCYQISITRNGSGQFIATATLVGGAPPLLTDSGEILIKLDWSSLSSFGGVSTTTVAQVAANALLSTNLIPDMAGHPLAELPMHLIGHSRGGSVVTEIARLLGAQGIWMDHVTTLDPRPVAQFGDAAVFTYSNVLFADNFWQTMGDGLIVPNGQFVSGAYNRKLLDLNGGYSSSHSDVHLWYHGTIDLSTPATDTQATITATQRASWWTAPETSGADAGFRYSFIGGGDRLSEAEPAGVGNGRIRDGFNAFWDLGGGIAPNRTPLPADSGVWPNPIRLLFAEGEPIPAGMSLNAVLYQQSGADPLGTVELELFLDLDSNPYDGNEIEIDQRMLPTTGTAAVSQQLIEATLDAATVLPGDYRVGARLSDGAHTRYLYAPGLLTVTPSLQPPSVDASTLAFTGGVLRFDVHGLPGQNVTVEASTDFADWVPIQSHIFTGAVWTFTDVEAGKFPRRFYRAVLMPSS